MLKSPRSTLSLASCLWTIIRKIVCELDARCSCSDEPAANTDQGRQTRTIGGEENEAPAGPLPRIFCLPSAISSSRSSRLSTPSSDASTKKFFWELYTDITITCVARVPLRANDHGP